MANVIYKSRTGEVRMEPITGNVEFDEAKVRGIAKFDFLLSGAIKEIDGEDWVLKLPGATLRLKRAQLLAESGEAPTLEGVTEVTPDVAPVVQVEDRDPVQREDERVGQESEARFESNSQADQTAVSGAGPTTGGGDSAVGGNNQGQTANRETNRANTEAPATSGGNPDPTPMTTVDDVVTSDVSQSNAPDKVFVNFFGNEEKLIPRDANTDDRAFGGEGGRLYVQNVQHVQRNSGEHLQANWINEGDRITKADGAEYNALPLEVRNAEALGFLRVDGKYGTLYIGRESGTTYYVLEASKPSGAGRDAAKVTAYNALGDHEYAEEIFSYGVIRKADLKTGGNYADLDGDGDPDNTARLVVVVRGVNDAPTIGIDDPFTNTVSVFAQDAGVSALSGTLQTTTGAPLLQTALAQRVFANDLDPDNAALSGDAAAGLARSPHNWRVIAYTNSYSVFDPRDNTQATFDARVRGTHWQQTSNNAETLDVLTNAARTLDTLTVTGRFGTLSFKVADGTWSYQLFPKADVDFYKDSIADGHVLHDKFTIRVRDEGGVTQSQAAANVYGRILETPIDIKLDTAALGTLFDNKGKLTGVALTDSIRDTFVALDPEAAAFRISGLALGEFSGSVNPPDASVSGGNGAYRLLVGTYGVLKMNPNGTYEYHPLDEPGLAAAFPEISDKLTAAAIFAANAAPAGALLNEKFTYLFWDGDSTFQTVNGAKQHHGTLTVTINGANDAPEFVTINGVVAQAQVTLVNAVENTVEVGKVIARDADQGTTKLDFEIVTGQADDAALFKLEGNTFGERTLVFNASPNFENPFSGKRDYTLTIRITDDHNITVDQKVTVTLLDANDVPTITSVGGVAADQANTIVINVNEAQSSVGSIVGADQDPADAAALTYSISGGADAGLFNINATTGAITFKAAPDFENPLDGAPGPTRDGKYDLIVRVSDGRGANSFAEQAVTINLLNVNDNNPTAPVYTTSLAENSSVLTLTTASSDPDNSRQAGFNTLTYEKSGNDAGLFNLDPNTGALTFIAAPNFEVPTDLGGDNVYNLTVTVYDGLKGAAGTRSTVANLAISVTNLNDNAPIAPTYLTTAAENFSGSLLVTQVSDLDNLKQPNFETFTYTKSGNDADLFDLSPTGVLTFKEAPNFEIPKDFGGDNVYNVRVTVADKDNVHSDFRDVVLTVTDVPELPSAPVYATTIDENSSSIPLITPALDQHGNNAKYSKSGTDAALFNIDADTGALTFIEAPNFDAPTDSGLNNIYNLTVTVKDGALETNTPLAITVRNLNDNAPSKPEYQLTVLEGTTSSLLTKASTDDDNLFQANFDTITYTKSGDPNNLFNLDSAGNLSFRTAPVFNVDPLQNLYNVSVTVSDSTIRPGGGVHSATYSYQFTVTSAAPIAPIEPLPAATDATLLGDATITEAIVLAAPAPQPQLAQAAAVTDADAEATEPTSAEPADAQLASVEIADDLSVAEDSTAIAEVTAAASTSTGADASLAQPAAVATAEAPALEADGEMDAADADAPAATLLAAAGDLAPSAKPVAAPSVAADEAHATATKASETAAENEPEADDTDSVDSDVELDPGHELIAHFLLEGGYDSGDAFGEFVLKPLSELSQLTDGEATDRLSSGTKLAADGTDRLGAELPELDEILTSDDADHAFNQDLERHVEELASQAESQHHGGEDLEDALKSIAQDHAIADNTGGDSAPPRVELPESVELPAAPTAPAGHELPEDAPVTV